MQTHIFIDVPPFLIKNIFDRIYWGSLMLLRITTVAELGQLIRAARKSQGVRLDDTAGSAGVGPVFAGDVERGKETVQLGLVLRLLEEVGLQLKVDVPQSVLPELKKLKAKNAPSVSVSPRLPKTGKPA